MDVPCDVVLLLLELLHGRKPYSLLDVLLGLLDILALVRGDLCHLW
jgi:hypothetical protein